MSTDHQTIPRIVFAAHLFEGLRIGSASVSPPERSLWLVAWMQLEDTRAAWNPLATELRLGGSTDFNADGVQNYLEAADGIAATIETLTGHDAAERGYRRIVRALFDPDASFADFRAAVAASGWSGLSPEHYQIPTVFGLQTQPHEHTAETAPDDRATAPDIGRTTP